MDPTLALFSILGALAVGAVSPGPSFVLVVRTSIAVSRRDGVATALGMGAGCVVYCALALFGLQVVIAQVPWLYTGLKLFGGLYLAWLGLRIWLRAGQPIAVADGHVTKARGVGRSFWLALAAQLSNPKTAVVYASTFAAFLPAEVPVWVLAVLPPAIFSIVASWYALVAVAFSSERPRTAYLRSKRWIDRTAGAVMGALGAKLMADAV